MCPEMHPEVRSPALMRQPRMSAASSDGQALAAARRLLGIYADLAARGAHLLEQLLAGQRPQQWAHYPEADAIDSGQGLQWFYHSHAPDDRPDALEHGHIHLFARKPLWARRLRSARERAFAALAGDTPATGHTRHLLAIGFDAKGLPISLFTVNSWVTGDRMLSAPLSGALLERPALDTGHGAIDGLILALLALYRGDILDLLAQRDRALFAWPGPKVLADRRLEQLSCCTLDLDARLRALAPLSG